ncbi:hypothetical protein P3X46_016657 [Hevea brasiliensis]|uniref:Ubiquitin-like domain-containing protein n=1 Tax=Hevea brasiliensis TaxID=3981 RepID=A0ABQ9LZU9_HEVBR|nr:hypothetical protein P3X46_016657 [Hevea brasiliensis]
MKMEKMKSKMKWVFRPANKSTLNGRGNVNVEDLEIRPGGLLVQKRNSDSNKNSVPIPSIKVSVKYGSLNYQICISSQASFGELKKMLAEQTGVHPQDQKLIYKKKERDSKAYLDISGVKDGSKIMLIENITSWERRSLEMIKSAKIEKASKYLQQISLEVDKLHTKERRVQKYIETLDMLKLRNSINNRTEDKIPKQQEENSTGKKPIPMQKLVQQQILRHSESFVITTNWETFD